MKRELRKRIAQETVEILERGAYRAEDGTGVDIAEMVAACVDATTLFLPEELERRRRSVVARPAEARERATTIEIVNETTLAGLTRLSSGGARVAALNFASAKNPGGGFLNGSQAQEESLARSSALYASLRTVPSFYDEHRASPSLLYSDRMILSPECPVFRRDDGTLLRQPGSVAFITSPAPNVGAMRDNRRAEIELVADVLRKRSEYVLALAATEGYERLVLGAWGCGVFQNDPRLVADAFMAHLLGTFRGCFEIVAFSVLDSAVPPQTFLAFEDALNSSRPVDG